MEYKTLKDIRELTIKSILANDVYLDMLYSDLMDSIVEAAENGCTSTVYTFESEQKNYIDTIRTLLKLSDFKVFVFSDNLCYISWEE